MDKMEFERRTVEAREKFLHPAMERALREGPAPMPAAVFAHFLTLVAALQLTEPDRQKVLARYQEISDFALRKYLALRDLDVDGQPQRKGWLSFLK